MKSKKIKHTTQMKQNIHIKIKDFKHTGNNIQRILMILLSIKDINLFRQGALEQKPLG